MKEPEPNTSNLSVRSLDNPLFAILGLRLHSECRLLSPYHSAGQTPQFPHIHVQFKTRLGRYVGTNYHVNVLPRGHVILDNFHETHATSSFGNMSHNVRLGLFWF